MLSLIGLPALATFTGIASIFLSGVVYSKYGLFAGILTFIISMVFISSLLGL